MLSEVYVVIFFVAGVVTLITLCLLGYLDRVYRMEARFAAEWDRHRDRYMKARLSLDNIDDPTGLATVALATLREHDLQNERFCESAAARHRARIPPRLRRYYLAA